MESKYDENKVERSEEVVYGPQVNVVGEVPIEILPTITTNVVDMTEDQREQFFKNLGDSYYERYLKNKGSGCYKRCHKTDWCKLEQEKKKKEQDTLLERNQILELHARKLETDFNDYKEQTDRRMTQLAELVRSMLEDQQPKLKRTKTIVRE